MCTSLPHWDHYMATVFGKMRMSSLGAGSSGGLALEYLSNFQASVIYQRLNVCSRSCSRPCAKPWGWKVMEMHAFGLVL